MDLRLQKEVNSFPQSTVTGTMLKSMELLAYKSHDRKLKNTFLKGIENLGE